MARLHVYKDPSEVTWGYNLYDDEDVEVMTGDGYDNADKLLEDLGHLGNTIVNAISNTTGVQIDRD